MSKHQNEPWSKENIHQKLIEDLIKEGKVFDVLDKDTSKWILKDFQNDGYVNFLFLLTDSNNKKIMIKWTSPYIITIFGFDLGQERGEFEREYMILNSSIYPNSTAKVYFYSEDRFYFAMEYLDGFENFKNQLIKGLKNDHFSEKIGEYLAYKGFKTSNLNLKPSEMLQNSFKFLKNSNTWAYLNHLNFKYHFDPKSNEKLHELVQLEIEKLQNSDKVKLRVEELQYEMVENIQSVVHGDFHTGSVLLKDDRVYIIDGEACTSGPMAYDSGVLFGNLIHSYFFQYAFEIENDDDRTELKKWILQSVIDTWNIFEKKFLELWTTSSSSFKKKYLKKIFDSTIGYSAILLVRGALELWPEYKYLNKIGKEKVTCFILKAAKLFLENDYDSIESAIKDIKDIKVEF